MEVRMFIVSVVLCLLFTYEVNAEEKNFCKNPNSNMEWEALIQKYPNDLDLHTLHALRLGLCIKIERGDITIDQATEIFEKSRNALINARTEEKENYNKKKVPLY